MGGSQKVVAEQTRGQLQRTLSQQIQKLYREQLDHSSGKITCRLFDDKLAIIIEDSLTQPESLLLEEGDVSLAKQVRSDLDEMLRPKLINVIESVLDRQVNDILSDATLATGRTGILVILSDPPQIRAPKNTSPDPPQSES